MWRSSGFIAFDGILNGYRAMCAAELCLFMFLCGFAICIYVRKLIDGDSLNDCVKFQIEKHIYLGQNEKQIASEMTVSTNLFINLTDISTQQYTTCNSIIIVSHTWNMYDDFV